MKFNSKHVIDKLKSECDVSIGMVEDKEDLGTVLSVIRKGLEYVVPMKFITENDNLIVYSVKFFSVKELADRCCVSEDEFLYDVHSLINHMNSETVGVKFTIHDDELIYVRYETELITASSMRLHELISRAMDSIESAINEFNDNINSIKEDEALHSDNTNNDGKIDPKTLN